MALMSQYGGDFELPPEGRHVAALVRFVDLGAQPGKFGVSRNAELAFEIEGEETADGRPMLAFKRIFNLSNRSKNFREVVRALSNMHDISGVNTSDLLGNWCEIVIAHVNNRGRFRVRECRVQATQRKGAVKTPGIGTGFLQSPSRRVSRGKPEGSFGPPARKDQIIANL